MPAGSGPNVNQVTGVALAADTAEHVLATIPPSFWNGTPLGLLVSFTVLLTGAATGNVSLRIRQGNAITGTQVGSTVTVALTATTIATPAMEFQDTSAFATGPNPQGGGQYVLTYQQSANSLGTATSALLELETIAPVQ
jgi:hypothetical protein